MLRFLPVVLIPCLMASCGGGKEKALSLEKKKSDEHMEVPDSLKKYTMKKSEVFDCMMNTIYYKLKVTNEDLDTIKTHYFHNIVDYEDLDVRAMSERLKRLREFHKDSADIKGYNPHMHEKEMDSLIQEINRYEKTVVGFIVVHSFFVKQQKDTMTMIFVMDKHCGYKDAIKIKSIANVNPEDYVNSFRSY